MGAPMKREKSVLEKNVCCSTGQFTWKALFRCCFAGEVTLHFPREESICRTKYFNPPPHPAGFFFFFGGGGEVYTFCLSCFSLSFFFFLSLLFLLFKEANMTRRLKKKLIKCCQSSVIFFFLLQFVYFLHACEYLDDCTLYGKYSWRSVMGLVLHAWQVGF